MDLDGRIIYSTIAKLNASAINAELVIYPNPVKGSQVSFQLNNLQKGTYTMMVYNNAGKQVYGEHFNYRNGSVNESLQLPAGIRPGVYNLQVRNEGVNLQKMFVIK